jgi:hypothetical protein
MARTFGHSWLETICTHLVWACGLEPEVQEEKSHFPYGDLIRTSFLYSTDEYNGNELNRPTLWVDDH